jgi:xylulokinase
VLEPGELAATAGTSGVVYGIVDKAVYEEKSRVNTFVHVNHRSGGSKENRFGVLLNLNGTGILNKWTKQVAADPLDGEPIDYDAVNQLASEAPIGSKGLVFLPFGNGAERILENADVNASLHNLNFNIHERAELFRAAQEGIVFALNFGIEIMRDMGLSVQTVRAGDANMFLSPIFREAFATTTGATVELYSTDGSEGAARGAGVGAGIYKEFDEAYRGLELKERIEPEQSKRDAYREAYERWESVLKERVLR